MRFFNLRLLTIVALLTFATPLLPALFAPLSAAAQTAAEQLAEADRLFQQGLLQDSTSEFGEVFQLWERALSIYRETDVRAAFPQKSREGEISVLGNMGWVLNNSGEFQQAIDLYEQQLVIVRERGDRLIESEVLALLGAVYLNLGQFQAAADLMEQSRIIKLELGSLEQENRPSDSETVITNPETTASSFYDLCAVEGEEWYEARATSNHIGELYGTLESESYQPMVDQSEAYLEIVRRTGDRLGEARQLMQMGATHYGFGQLSMAKDSLLAAISVFESMEADLVDTNQVSFFDTYQIAYWHLQQLLVAQNEIEQALIIAEQGRAKATIRLLSSQTTSQTATAPNSILDRFTLADIQRVAREQNATLVEYTVVNYSSLDNPVIYIWVIQPTGELSFQQVDITDTDLHRLTCLTRVAIGARGREPGTIALVPAPESQQRQEMQQRQNLQQLYNLLIEPIAQHLPTNETDRLIFIPQGELFLVPFAALTDSNGNYLIENHTILTAPSIQVLDLTHQQRGRLSSRGDLATQGDEMLIVGNPRMPQVWNPETQEEEPLSALQGAEAEAVAIAHAFGTQPLLRDQASETTVKQRMVDARVIHLATHGLLEYSDPREPDVQDFPGAIALAPSIEDDGLLTAVELHEMNLTAELVVLSACDTGRGDITGDGVIGLSRALINAGVPSVVASLWKVPDASTFELMNQFYQNLRHTSDKAQALRQAMLTTMQAHPDPLDWAAFTLVGEAD